MDGIAVDAGWLREIEDVDEADSFARVQFLQRLNDRQVALLLDYDGHIAKEYQRNLLPRSFGRKFFVLRMKFGPLMYFSGQPISRCRVALVKDGFHSDDVPYVAVAQRGRGAYLTHEAKHCQPGRKRIIASECGVIVGTHIDLISCL